MKILEINKFFYARRGAERHFLDLLSLLEKEGHETAVFSMRHPENITSKWETYFVSHVGYNHDDSTFFERVSGLGRLFWSFEARRNMKVIIRDFRPELVHVHNAYHQLSLSFFPIIKKSGIPLIMTVHDYAMISPDKDSYYPEVGRQYWKFLWVKKYGFGKRFLLVLKKYWEDLLGFYDCVDRFIVPSHFVENILLSAGIARERIVVSPHFITDEEISSEEIADVEIPSRYLFSFGAVSEEKGIGILLDISLESEIPLLIAGRLEGEFDFSRYPLARYIGIRTKEELGTLIRQSIGVISASSLPETFGLSALETIACGRPFFGLDRGALSEIIENDRSGFLAENEEKLKKAVSRFLSGERTFDTPDTIKAMAREKFGARAYMLRFQGISESLTRKS